jgi:ABC-type antimicrobial peptide transport system permease subunit
MLRNYFKIAWRNLVKNKLHSSINIGGLIIGFTIGITILAVVYNQFSYDHFHKNRDKIFQAYQVFNNPDGEQITNSFGYAQAPVYKAEAGAIEKTTRFVDGGNHIECNGVDKQIPVSLVDEDFLSMFSFTVLKGNRTNPLKNLSDAVLTEEAAKKLFGNDDPIGKTIKATVGDKMQLLVVSALIQNISNSSIYFQVLARIENRANYSNAKLDWGDRAPVMYVQLRDGADKRQAELQLREIDKKYVPGWYTDMAAKGAKPDKYGDLFATRLLPLDEVHFSTRVNGHHAVSYLQMITMMTVGLLIIFIACFNFVNINLANAFTRSREIGVRKCLGAAKSRLFAQLWSESFLICAIAFFCSLVLVNVLLHAINGLDQFRNVLLNEIWKPGFLIWAVMLLLFVSLIAGGYPSWLMIRFKVVESLKGKISMKRKSSLRSSLIVMQFVIACIMISCTYIIYRQYQYLQNADLGINKAFVISVPLHQPEKGMEIIEKLRERLVSNPHILSVTGSNINMGRGSDHRTSKSSTDFSYKDKQIHSNFASVEYDYLKTFGLKPIEGRDFDKSFGSDTSHNIIISESVAKQFNEKNLIGKYIGADSNFSGWHVIGIFPDFHLYSMEEQLEPLSLTLDAKSALNYCFIKITSQNPVATMDIVKKEMSLLEPGQEFTGTFVDENISNWYQAEKSMSVLFSIAASVAILLSCSGLLAMVLLVIQQRIKEIGVRKVLGASVRNISLLISKDFLRLVGLAVLIATPISWFAMYKWLEDFPYRIQMQPWMFALVGFMALLIAMLTISANTIRAAMQNPVKSLRTE